jgi:hypothetical protein
VGQFGRGDAPRVLNAPDAVLLTARVTTGGTATVVMSRRDRALVFRRALSWIRDRADPHAEPHRLSPMGPDLDAPFRSA